MKFLFIVLLLCTRWTEGEEAAKNTRCDHQLRLHALRFCEDSFAARHCTIEAAGSDLGTMDARGYVQITGRLRDVIIRGGENIYPREIEAVLLEHPTVADVAVFGVPHDHWGEVIGTVVRASDPDKPPTISELQAHCRAALAPFRLPTEWFICTEFPLTGSGKVQKFRLREQLQAGALTRLAPLST